VRGYRENQSLKDSGFIANLSISAPILSAGANDGMSLRAEVFYDYGRGENTAEALNVDTEVELSSAGVGFSAEYRNLKIRIQKAVRLKRKEKLGDALQDSGIHVGVTYEL
jgi:hemolysin activation/secretion protein